MTLNYYMVNPDIEDVESANSENTFDINTKDRKGNTPFLCAVRNGGPDVVSFFLRNEYVNIYESNVIFSLSMLIFFIVWDFFSFYHTYLHIAVDSNRLDILECLLETDGVSINTRDVLFELLISIRVLYYSYEYYGATPLLLAAKDQNIEISRLLLSDPNIDVNCTDNNNMAPIHIIAQNGNQEIAKMLFSRKDLDLSIVTKNGVSIYFLITYFLSNSSSYSMPTRKHTSSVILLRIWTEKTIIRRFKRANSNSYCSSK